MRLFICIEITPNQEIRSVLAEAKKLGLRTVAEDKLHINIKFLGEVDEIKANQVKMALNSLIGFGSFEVVLEDIGSFPNRRVIHVIWIGVRSERILKLAKLVDEELSRLGFNKEKSYTPHVTLARVPRRIKEVERLLVKKMFGSQKVEEIHLIKSTLSPSGPIYEKIHSVKL